jgi:hypothetical protein
MSWRWVCASGSAGSSPGLDRTFTSQGDAETWLGEFYPDLLDSGCRAVTLYEEDRLVYGPMPLAPRLDPEPR